MGRSLETETQDVARSRRGDSRAFERLYRTHQARVYSLALRMAGGEWAEDLTQEVFVRAWQKLSTFRGEASFGTWLHRLAINLILSKRETLNRRARRFVPGGDALDRMAARPETPGAGIDLETAIQKLPDGARQVFVLFEVEGFPHAEISRMMQISEGTSKSQLHRARMILREHLA